ncbi:MAG: FecR domain-containing protein [Erythrobacter sp.]|nr:MAG: FecR domain-containing protein [Erythrobacter sp.]
MRMMAEARMGLAALLFASVALASGAQAQATDGYITYHMEPGDTLISVQQRFLKRGDSLAAITRLNRITNVRRIPVGTRLLLPRDLLAWRPAGLVVRSFSGPVTIDGAAPVIGAPLSEGAVIRTGAGGFVTFQSPDGAAIALPSNSHARLERARVYALRDLRDVEFRILNGRGEVQAPTLRGDERFRTSTPVAVTAVRGTEYRVSFDEASGLGTTEVIEGAVWVERSEDERLTGEGYGIAAREAGLSAPELLLPPAAIAAPGAVQTEEVVAFAVTPPPGAQESRTQIARDAGFLEMLAEDVSADGDTVFSRLEDGRYFVRARGIAASGVEGLSETFSFRRKRLGVEATVEASPLADGFRFAWLPQGEGVTHFAFQLWREGEAATPLYDELALPGSATVITGLAPGTYIWRVAAIQADAEEGLLKVWGPEQSLTVSPE